MAVGDDERSAPSTNRRTSPPPPRRRRRRRRRGRRRAATRRERAATRAERHAAAQELAAWKTRARGGRAPASGGIGRERRARRRSTEGTESARRLAVGRLDAAQRALFGFCTSQRLAALQLGAKTESTGTREADGGARSRGVSYTSGVFLDEEMSADGSVSFEPCRWQRVLSLALGLTARPNWRAFRRRPARAPRARASSSARRASAIVGVREPTLLMRARKDRIMEAYARARTQWRRRRTRRGRRGKAAADAETRTGRQASPRAVALAETAGLLAARRRRRASLLEVVVPEARPRARLRRRRSARRRFARRRRPRPSPPSRRQLRRRRTPTRTDVSDSRAATRVVTEPEEATACERAAGRVARVAAARAEGTGAAGTAERCATACALGARALGRPTTATSLTATTPRREELLEHGEVERDPSRWRRACAPAPVLSTKVDRRSFASISVGGES